MEKKMYKIRLKKGDLVQVLSGKYKGKQGKVSTADELSPQPSALSPEATKRSEK